MSQPYAKFVAELKAALGAVLRTQRSAVHTESGIHVAIAEALTAMKKEFKHEHRLNDRDRLDFLITPGIFIEAKKGAAGIAVLQQCGRYLDHPDTTCAVIVAMRCDGQMPATFRDKPVFVIELWRLVL
jgi:hypothetical protein